MYPKHHKKILAQIKERMSDKSKSCVLISTSLVEAGVDLDFNSVYRQVAGVDSVIQAAGRCNREGIEKERKVYIFDINGIKTVPGQSLQAQSLKGYCKIIMIFLILNALQNISKGYISF